MPACAAGERCRVYDPHHQLPGWAESGPMCESCLSMAERDIRALVYDYVDLEQFIPPSAGSYGPKISGSSDPSIPIALGVEALQRLIVHVVTTWETVVRERAWLSAPVTHGVRDGWAVQRGVEVIVPRIRTLCRCEPVAVWPDGPESPPGDVDGVGAVLAMVDLHRRAKRLLGLTRIIERLPGECSECGLAVLRRDSGSEIVYCAGCHCEWAYVDYRRYVNLALAGLSS